MGSRFDTLPDSLRQRARATTLAGVPALIAHPELGDARPAATPVVLWMHGRTADKELDPGRYQRWLRAGIAACAIDLPGHGQRSGPPRHEPHQSLEVLAEALGELPRIVKALIAEHPGHFDTTRIAVGGMSLGGMVALRALCAPHLFAVAAVECTTGWLAELYHPTLPDPPGRIPPVSHNAAAIAPLDPAANLSGFRPIPLLALHGEADQVVPWAGQREFLRRLADHYDALGADRSLIEVRTWPETGAPMEHAGFGRIAAQAKDVQTDFLRRRLTAP